MNKLKVFIIKVLYALGANLINLLVSLLTAFFIPKFFSNDIEQYGYLQIYLFYFSYIGFFHFGLCDGIFLRDGGKEYKEINKNLYSSQFWLFLTFEFIISLFVLVLGYIFANSKEYVFISVMIAINIVIYMARLFLAYVLQTTNRIKEFASVNTVGRLFYGLLIIVIIFFELRDYHFFVYADLLGKFLALCVAIYWCKNLVFAKPVDWIIGLKEAIYNISVGSKLMFSNIASMLINGVVCLGVQYKWSVATYGKVSFAMNLSNFIMVFVSAVALVLYPTLRRIEKEKLVKLYSQIRSIIMVPLLGLLVLYYPFSVVLQWWLPQYSESFKYMAILFPLCVLSTKMSMLIQTYMNVFRLEKTMLRVNFVGLIVAIFMMLLSVFYFESLLLAVFTIVINQLFRIIYAEVCLSRILDIKIFNDNCLECFLILLYIVLNYYMANLEAATLYLFSFGVYIFIKKNELKDIYVYLKNETKR